MPTVFRDRGVRFFFYSNEGDPREPPHVHAESAEGVAKLWLRPAVAVAFSAGYDRRALAGIVTTVSARRDEIERAWHEFFG